MIDADTPGRIAQRQIIEDLRYSNCSPRFLLKYHPDRVFKFGEDGWGVLLAPDIAYMQSGYTNDIYQDSEPIVVENGWYKYPGLGKTCILGEIPEELISEVTSLARTLREEYLQIVVTEPELSLTFRAA